MFGKRVTVMGLGLHGGGASVALWLAKHGARVTVTDLKTKKELQSSITRLQLTTDNLQLHLGRHRKQDFIDTDMVVRNPAVPIESPFLKIAEKHGIPIESEATLFFKYCASKNIIGVTGTRGKSTTSAMIATILKESQNQKITKSHRVWLAGNIRTTPMLSIVDRVKPNDWVVLELSSWHCEDMDRHRISPHVAVVTNLLQDHLNRYTGMRSYARAKEGIVRYQKEGDIAVLNQENAWTRAMAKKTKAKIYWFPNKNLQLTTPTLTVGAPTLSGVGAYNLQLVGEHNRMNAQAAATVTHALGVPLRIIRSAIRTFRGLPDRLEYIGTVRGVRYYNDTTATTPDATIAALETLSKNHKNKKTKKHIVLIAGGSDKNLDYHLLMPWIKKTCKAVVLLPGTATKKIKKSVVSCQLSVVAEAATMPSAVRKAASLATRGDIVLLSPAAASFGLFQHEFDRGDQFRTLVKMLQ